MCSHQTNMKKKIRLTGKRFRHSASREGIQLLQAWDTFEQNFSVVWVIGPWAYQMTDESIKEKRA